MENKCIVIAKFGGKYTSDMMLDSNESETYQYAVIRIDDCGKRELFREYVLAFMRDSNSAFNFIKEGDRVEYYNPKGIDPETKKNSPVFINDILSLSNEDYDSLKLMYDFTNEIWHEIVYLDKFSFTTHKLESLFGINNPMKIYLSMPITGHDMDERKEFADKIKSKLTNDEHQVITPFDVIPCQDKRSWEECMKLCLKDMIECDAVLLSKDWITSKGCRVEYLVAKSCGMMITDEIYL